MPTSSAQPAPTAPPPLSLPASATQFTDTPSDAADFVDSVGVNVDLTSLSNSNVSQLAHLVQAMGVQHVRLAILRTDPPYDATVSAFLSASGAKALGVTNCAPALGPYPGAVITKNDVNQFAAAIGNQLEIYEAMNEPDNQQGQDVNWISDLRSCMQNQIGAPYPFLAPAIADEDSFANAVGNLSSIVNAGNIHRYFSGRNPASSGWGATNGCGGYGALNWAICESQIVSGPKPIYVTETGYNSTNEVDVATQAKYLSRMLFVNFNARIKRSYVYCLVSYTGADGFGGDGLLQSNFAPKPAYNAIKTAMSAVSDYAGINAPIPIHLAINGPPTLMHTIFRKSDGSLILVLWNEVSSWNSQTHVPINVTPSNATVTFVTPIGAVSATALDDSGNANPKSLSKSVNGFQLSIDDHLTFVKIMP